MDMLERKALVDRYRAAYRGIEEKAPRYLSPAESVNVDKTDRRPGYQTRNARGRRQRIDALGRGRESIYSRRMAATIEGYNERSRMARTPEAYMRIHSDGKAPSDADIATNRRRARAVRVPGDGNYRGKVSRWPRRPRRTGPQRPAVRVRGFRGQGQVPDPSPNERQGMMSR